MSPIHHYLSHYGKSHQNRINKLIHGLAVPSIYFVTLALIWSIPMRIEIATLSLSLAHILIIPIMAYYFYLSLKIGVAMGIMTIFCFAGIAMLQIFAVPVWLFSLVLFAIMWVLQFIGHYIEGKRPSFFEDLRYLLIGPAWWWMHVFKRLNIKV